MTALSSFRRLLDVRVALFGAFWASACQPDAGAAFDDARVPAPTSGGVSNAGSSQASAGDGRGASAAADGSATAGTAVAGLPGTGGGTSASPPYGGGNAATAGGSEAQAAGQGGTADAGAGGDAAAGMAGSPGSHELDPITIELTELYDTYLSSNSSDTNYGDRKTLIVDRNPGEVSTHSALLRAGLAAIPAGASVSAAALTLTCARAGDPITFSYVDSSWQEPSVSWDSRPSQGSVIGSAGCDQSGHLTLDLASALSAWLAGTHANFGVYLSVEAMDASEFHSKEADEPSQRPRLTVTYTPAN